MSRLLAGIDCRAVHCIGVSWTWPLQLIAHVGSQSADGTKFNFRKPGRLARAILVSELIEATTVVLVDFPTRRCIRYRPDVLPNRVKRSPSA